jgi:FkbM family methyltransferase
MHYPVQGNVFLRRTGSDILTFHEVMRDQVYDVVSRYVEDCGSIIDLGANIGLASLYFAHTYPSSVVLAVEPNPDTYDILELNLQQLIEGGRCKTLKAAGWGAATTLGGKIGVDQHHFSAFAVEEAKGNGEHIKGLPMSELIVCSGFEYIDLVKVDIEGAEVQLFSGPTDWLKVVKVIAIEFHGDSRRASRFDSLMEAYGFKVYDGNQHTVIAVNHPLRAGVK